MAHELVEVRQRAGSTPTVPVWWRFVCSCGRAGIEHTFQDAAERMWVAHKRAAQARENEEASAAAVIA